ncbi:unnamed protein product [Onchocerca ochengi]|uniref:Uncharacterized protein n=1 Tax=Onchocerca ochengi TaxID=42157 RepID=A0A182E363_ONCOC|nr:unnamed protein product [Onchocerca ochengi]
MDRVKGEGGWSLTREMASDKWRTGYRKVNLAGKGSKDSFPTGTTDIPPGILIVIHSLYAEIYFGLWWLRSLLSVIRGKASTPAFFGSRIHTKHSPISSNRSYLKCNVGALIQAFLYIT